MRFKKQRYGTDLETNRYFTAEKLIEVCEPPPEVIIPLNMAIGLPANPIVVVGDKVKIGTLIAESGNGISANHHASISGIVTAIEARPTVKGIVDCIVIENDFLNEEQDCWYEEEKLIETIRRAGIIGMGGAGFPTHFKLATEKKIDTIIVNGAECEPYATSDARVMIEYGEEVLNGAIQIANYFQAEKIYVGIEHDDPLAVQKMTKAAKLDPRIIIKELPTRYPMGAEKILIKECVGREVPLFQLPADIGCIVSNVNTFYWINQALENRRPLTHRVVSVTGTPIANPRNLLIPIGTPLDFVIEQCGGFKEDPKQAVMGGPMMGTSIQDGEIPLVKTTTHVVFLSESEAMIPAQPDPCIRCAECINVCPVALQPILISNAYERKDLKAAEELGALSCIECGNCSYICPSNIPLLENIIAAKQEILMTRG